MRVQTDLLEQDLLQRSSFRNTRNSANKMYADRAVVVKAFVPQSLKTRFKVCCIRHDLKMSTVLEQLIRQWIQSESLDLHIISHPSGEVVEEVKGYIPKALKQQFKILCTQHQFQMSYVLHFLIQEWLQINCKDSDC